MAKIPVAILGTNGIVGQQYRALLESHPFFALTFQVGGKRDISSPQRNAEKLAKKCRFVFSALPSSIAKEYEFACASNGLAVFSSASYSRLDPDIPLIIPEINPDHLAIIPWQQKNRQWKGFIIAKPNCTLQSYLLPLFPLHRAFTLTHLLITTLQATSGGGKSFSLDGNVIPFIAGEEEKSEKEPLKILGKHTPTGILPQKGIHISAHCNRVPVKEGHLTCISAAFKEKPTQDLILKLWHTFDAETQKLSLPSAPKHLLHYLPDLDRPQPVHDVHIEAGMVATIGRLRSCSVLDIRFTSLSHNLIRGASGSAILTAELLYKKGWL